MSNQQNWISNGIGLMVLAHEKEIPMRFLSLSFVIVIAGTTVQATPPNVVTISDIYLGASADQVFLLRTIDDNLGVYAPAALDIYLLARSKAGTEPDDAWPVRRKIYYRGWEDQPDQDVPIDNAVDPFAIMSDRGAWPRPLSRTKELPQITYDPSAIRFQSTAYEGWEDTPATHRFVIGFEAAMTQLNSSHAATRVALKQYPGMNGGSDSVYYFQASSFASECEPLVSGHLFDEGQIDALLVEYDCKMEGDEYISAQVYLVIPIVPDNN
jgi:hypothetical protein